MKYTLTLLFLALAILACSGYWEQPKPVPLELTPFVPFASTVTAFPNLPTEVQVIADALEVRSCASETCPTLEWLENGDTVIVTGNLDEFLKSDNCSGWLKIEAGYICKDWIK